jgi:hypothetical protein
MTTKSDQRKNELTSATALTQYGLQSNPDVAHVGKATTWIREPRWRVEIAKWVLRRLRSHYWCSQIPRANRKPRIKLIVRLATPNRAQLRNPMNIIDEFREVTRANTRQQWAV